MSIFERMVKEFEAGNYEVVIALAKDVLDKSPSHDMAWRAMGAALLELGDITKAVKAVSKSLVSAPQIPETHFNLANIVLKNSGDTGKALKGYLRAVRLAPNFTEANNNLGNIHKDSHRLDQALISYYKTVASNPAYIEGFWNISIVYLLQGRFREGWRMYEWRWRKSHLEPEWMLRQHSACSDLSTFRGKTLLVQSEQGLGDSLQFFRFVPLACRIASKVSLQVEQPLVRLFRTSLPTVSIIAKNEEVPAYDSHCALMSLPLALNIDQKDLAPPHPYLRTTNDVQGETNKKSKKGKIQRIGLVWSGNPQLQNDGNRSIPLIKLLSFLPFGPKYFSLQKDVRDSDIEALRSSTIVDCSLELEDLHDTAALCETMDLVISVDTSAAHLAGALFIPTWLLLPFSPDWRWGLTGITTVWYPTMTLYRQSENRRWDPVLSSVRADLTELI